jgi:hypothetical protein
MCRPFPPVLLAERSSLWRHFAIAIYRTLLAILYSGRPCKIILWQRLSEPRRKRQTQILNVLDALS